MNEEDLSKKKVVSWANTNFSHSTVFRPKTEEEIISIIQKAKESGKKVFGRGAGRSFGDQSLSDGNIVVDMTQMNKILEWNKDTGVLRVQAGANYDRILCHCIYDGWVPAVIPGTRYVTMGGALANNIHGKNSYKRGNFGRWVLEFRIILATGECLTCSDKVNSDLFMAVIGGSGLLGIVTEMSLQLVRVPSGYLSVKKTTASSFNELLDNLDHASEKDDFVIAQVDCFPEKVGLGRGTIHAASFTSNPIKAKSVEEMRKISTRLFGVIPKILIPMVGKYILNDFIMGLVSRLKYHLDKKTSSEKSYNQDVFNFTFLLDGVPNWMKVFRHGLFEYQSLLPKDKARIIIPRLIALTHKYKMPAYLSAIKLHSKDDFLLSYSMDGYSFAMDIPRIPEEKEEQKKLFQEMNKIVIESSGIIYLAKDANLTKQEFKQMYKNLEKFMELKRKYDPETLVQSDMYRRIFI